MKFTVHVNIHSKSNINKWVVSIKLGILADPVCSNQLQKFLKCTLNYLLYCLLCKSPIDMEPLPLFLDAINGRFIHQPRMLEKHLGKYFWCLCANLLLKIPNTLCFRGLPRFWNLKNQHFMAKWWYVKKSKIGHLDYPGARLLTDSWFNKWTLGTF